MSDSIATLFLLELDTSRVGQIAKSTMRFRRANAGRDTAARTEDHDDHREHFEELSKLSGRDFDRKYIEQRFFG